MGFDFRMLREIRERQPLRVTQKDVAVGTGIKRGNYAKKETGQVVVTIDDLEKLAAFYGISTAEFFLTREEIQELCDSFKISGKSMELRPRIDEAFELVMKLHRQIEQKDLEIAELKGKICK